MKKNIKSIYKFEIIILLLILLIFCVQNNNYKNIVSIIGLGTILVIASLVYKKKKDTNFYRGSAFRIVFAVLIFYFILIFLLGLLLGYAKTLFSLTPRIWLQGLIPAFLSTFFIERLRFILIKNNVTDKLAIYILTLLTTLLYIIINTNVSTLNTSYEIFVLICTTIIPIIAQELLSNYMIYNYGFLPTIGYKLIMNMYVYIIPIFTKLGDYLYSALGIIIPFTIYIVLKKYIKTNEDIRQKNQKLTGLNISFITIPIIILLIVIILLASGIFKFQIIAIASNSMVPVYERGDTIILEKVDKKSIESGDILVFKKDNIIVAHRVVKTKEVSSKIYFYTKGDANNSVDNTITSEDEVIGVVRRVVKYIGYPTVWINELLRR